MDTEFEGWSSHPPYRDACSVSDDPIRLSIEYPAEAYPWMNGPIVVQSELVEPTSECMYVCHKCSAERSIDHIQSVRIDGDWWYVCLEPCGTESTDRTWPDMMRAPEYDAIIKALVEAHPEDLVNIISRVIHDRTDMTGPDNREFSYGEIIVPGCPGANNCGIDEMGQEHIEYPDRLFTFEITGEKVSGCPVAPDEERLYDHNGDPVTR